MTFDCIRVAVSNTRQSLTSRLEEQEGSGWVLLKDANHARQLLSFDTRCTRVERGNNL